MKFKTKLIEIEAMQYIGPDRTKKAELRAFDAWIKENQGDVRVRYLGPTMFLWAPGHVMEAHPDDWIARGVTGLFVIPAHLVDMMFDSVS